MIWHGLSTVFDFECYNSDLVCKLECKCNYIVMCSSHLAQLQSSVLLAQHVTKHCLSLKIVIWNIFRLQIISVHFCPKGNCLEGHKKSGVGQNVFVLFEISFPLAFQLYNASRSKCFEYQVLVILGHFWVAQEVGGADQYFALGSTSLFGVAGAVCN